MMERDSQQPVEILLVEDNPADVRLTLEVLKDARVRNRVNVVEDGEQALSYLRREDGFSAATAADLVLLDLNLPKKDGREVLAEIKADPQLRKIPVVVLTTSAAEADVLKAYESHANAYITKPVDFQQFIEAVRSLEEFWLAVVRLPRFEA
jgi:chemotaxis family two-component system response regulator Rcp1